MDSASRKKRLQIAQTAIEVLVQQYSDTRLALFQCGELPQDRATLMAQYSDDVWRLGGRDWLRQKAA